MEVPRLGVELELQLPAYTIAMPDSSHVCNLHHSFQQCRILNPLSEAWDQTHILVDTSQLSYTEPDGNSHRHYFRFCSHHTWARKNIALPLYNLEMFFLSRKQSCRN